jgi:uncharacterized protein YneF (UPF0154 family)
MEDYITIIVTGLCTGLGSSIGNYLATRYLLKHLDKVSLEKMIENGTNKRK